MGIRNTQTGAGQMEHMSTVAQVSRQSHFKEIKIGPRGTSREALTLFLGTRCSVITAYMFLLI